MSSTQQNLILDVDRVIKHLLISDMFYGLFMSYITKKEDSSIELTRINVNKSTMEYELLINPDKWYGLSFDEKFVRLKHEALHLTNFHPLTADLYEKKKLDNIACDLEVNQFLDNKYLNEDSQKLSTFKQKYPKLDWKEKAGRDHYYQQLLKLPPEEQDKCANGLCAADQHDWSITDGDGNPQDGLTEGERQALQMQIQGAIEQIAEEISKSQGSLPCEINQLIKGFIKPKPKYDYSKFIKNFVGNSTKYKIGTTKLRENQRFPGQPKVVLKPLSRIAIYVDESGSVGEKVLHDFLNEIWHLKKKHDICIFPFDTQVLEQVKFEKNGNIKRTACGGTDPLCCIEHFEKNNFTSAIIYTDGYFSPVRTTAKNLLWVIDPNGDMKSTNNQKRVIQIPHD